MAKIRENNGPEIGLVTTTPDHMRSDKTIHWRNHNQHIV